MALALLACFGGICLGVGGYAWLCECAQSGLGHVFDFLVMSGLVAWLLFLMAVASLITRAVIWWRLAR